MLLDWRIWHKAPTTVWEKLLRQLDDLLSSGDDVNFRAFANAKAIIKILYTSKVNSATCYITGKSGGLVVHTVKFVNFVVYCRSGFDCEILMIANCEFFLELAITRIAK